MKTKDPRTLQTMTHAAPKGALLAIAVNGKSTLTTIGRPISSNSTCSAITCSASHVCDTTAKEDFSCAEAKSLGSPASRYRSQEAAHLSTGSLGSFPTAQARSGRRSQLPLSTRTSPASAVAVSSCLLRSHLPLWAK